jgi:hypothetical protein
MTATVTAAPTKVMCFPPRRSATDWHRTQIVDVQRSLPFVWSRLGVMSHRVRYVTLYKRDGATYSVHVTAWCGQGVGTAASPSKLSDAPHPDRPVCGTCHGRAIGAGQIDEEGTPLLFSPRTGVGGRLGQCVYEVATSSWCGSGNYFRCHRDAVAEITEVEGRGVCAQHERVWPPKHTSKYQASLAYANEGRA